MTGPRCSHWADGRPVPCPPMCPYQTRPPAMWRRTLFGRWKLRRPRPAEVDQIVPPRRIPDAPLYHPACTCPRLVKPDRFRDAQMWDPGCLIHFTMEDAP